MYVREEWLDLLGGVVERIQIPSDWADWIADGVRESQSDLSRRASRPSPKSLSTAVRAREA